MSKLVILTVPLEQAVALKSLLDVAQFEVILRNQLLIDFRNKLVKEILRSKGVKQRV